MSDDVGRYAIYFTPSSASALARFGAEWLGYDVTAGDCPPQPVIAAIAPERLRHITEEPRRYGFHATLKPPFVLTEGADVDALDEAAAVLACRFPTFAAPRLRLACLSGFWALMLSKHCPMVDGLAAACVAEFDRFRAPPSAAELARRRSADLSAAQEALLRRWGYPYVMEEFRFHMTLTTRLDPVERAVVGAELASLVAPFCQTVLAVDAIGLFHQECRDTPFRLLRRYKLAV
jgi:putative phosphonate metabolism protein